MPSYPIIVGKRLRKARELRGLSQVEAAKLAGIGVGQYNHYETGLMGDTLRTTPYLPTLTNARRLACALDVSLDWLVGLSDQMEL